MPNPRYFFEKVVKPSYEAWLFDPLCEWKAKTAASNADAMAERVFLHWYYLGKQMPVAGTTSATDYKAHLRDHLCEDFGLVWDVHEGYHHVTLTRANQRREGTYSEAVLGRTEQIVIELDDKSKRAFSGVMHNVMEMWRKQLADTCL